jgi:bacterioferritin-associated ferredoxin
MADFAQTKKHNLNNGGYCSKCREMAKALLSSSSSSSVRKSSQ